MISRNIVHMSVIWLYKKITDIQFTFENVFHKQAKQSGYFASLLFNSNISLIEYKKLNYSIYNLKVWLSKKVPQV